MLASYTTEEGFTLSVHGTMYMDYGLAIHNKDGEQLYYSPCCLSNDSYGRKPHERFDEWEDAEDAELEGDTNAFVSWEEADTFIEAYLGPDATP